MYFRFEYVFQLNIQSIKDCDPMKFTKETGPHYVSKNNKRVITSHKE